MSNVRQDTTETGTILLSKEEYKAHRALEIASKRGMVELAPSSIGNKAKFKVKAPWYDSSHRMRQSNLKKESSLLKTFKPTQEVYKYRKGACENCGAITHTTKECTERPRKLKAKFSGSNFRADEDLKSEIVGFEGKRDRWNGYNPDNYAEVIDEYKELEGQLAKKHQLEGTIVQDDFKEKKLNREFLDQEYDPKTKSFEPLRNRYDTAKYLHNLDADDYNGKTRSLNSAHNQNDSSGSMQFESDNFSKHTGEALNFMEQERFTWNLVSKGNSEINSYATPLLAERMFKESQKKSKMLHGENFEKTSERYGGTEYFKVPVNNLLIQQDRYVEYDQHGKVITKGMSQEVGKSRYLEDSYPSDHTSVWGSWWNRELGWGFSCCHGTDRNAVCLSDRGKKLAIVKEYKIVKKRETDLKALDFTEDVKRDLRNVKSRIEQLEGVIENSQIHINMEGQKIYEQQVRKSNKFVNQLDKERDLANNDKYINAKRNIDPSERERSRSSEKNEGSKRLSKKSRVAKEEESEDDSSSSLSN